MSTVFHAATMRQQTPIRSIVEQNRELGAGPLTRGELPWGAIGLLAIAAICAAVFAWSLRRRRSRRRPASERAFSRMARKLRLGRQGRELVRQLAAESKIDALALLVSPSALRVALSRIDAGEWRTRRGWKHVVALAKA
jgi:hypothetical protein